LWTISGVGRGQRRRYEIKDEVVEEIKV